jgi:hypothetical protein
MPSRSKSTSSTNERNAAGALCGWLLFYAVAAVGGYIAKSAEFVVAMN